MEPNHADWSRRPNTDAFLCALALRKPPGENIVQIRNPRHISAAWQGRECTVAMNVQQISSRSLNEQQRHPR
jgi:hypothetical protein